MKIQFRLQKPDKRLKALKDSHKNERCFIVGLGPSLTIEDLELLHKNNEYTFSVNRCYKMYNSTKWRPNCYFITDAVAVTKESKSAIKKMLDEGITVLYSKLEMGKLFDEAIYFKANFIDFVLRNSRKRKYRDKSKGCIMSTDAYEYINAGSSCIHSAIQLAYYMGFKEVYLIGTDCGASGSKSYSDAIGYNDNTYVSDMGNLMIRDYQNLKNDIDSKKLDFKIYNATRGGYLEVFPRVLLEDLYNAKKENNR